MCCAANFEALDGWGDATGSRFTEEGKWKRVLGVSDHLKTMLGTNSASAAATTAMKTPAEAMPPACRILVPKPRRSGGRRQPHWRSCQRRSCSLSTGGPAPAPWCGCGGRRLPQFCRVARCRAGISCRAPGKPCWRPRGPGGWLSCTRGRQRMCRSRAGAPAGALQGGGVSCGAAAPASWCAPPETASPGTPATAHQETLPVRRNNCQTDRLSDTAPPTSPGCPAVARSVPQP